MSLNLKSANARSKLAPRREPYWSRLEKGGFVGYRKAEQGAGTWIARWRDDEGKQKYNALGPVADFDEACKAARQWIESNRQGVAPKAITVADACREYVSAKRVESKTTADDAEGRFKRLVYGQPIGALPLSKLRAKHVEDWRNAQVRDDDEEDEDDARRSRDSANRNLSSLKAALNHAFRRQQVASDVAWRAVVAFKDAGRRRDTYLTLKQRQSLLKRCGPELAAFVRGLLLTGIRPGALAACNVGDLDGTTLHITKDKTDPRDVPLSTEAAALMKAQAKGKVGASTPLFARVGGQRWTKEAWRDELKEAVRAAKLPEATVAYSLRHSSITDMLKAGVSVFVVARLTGTSVRMVEKHYGHLLHVDAVRALDQAKLA